MSVLEDRGLMGNKRVRAFVELINEGLEDSKVHTTWQFLVHGFRTGLHWVVFLYVAMVILFDPSVDFLLKVGFLQFCKPNSGWAGIKQLGFPQGLVLLGITVLIDLFILCVLGGVKLSVGVLVFMGLTLVITVSSFVGEVYIRLSEYEREEKEGV